MRENIYATLPDTDSATKAVAALLDHGVKAEDMSVLIKTLPAEYGETHDVFVKAEEGITVTTKEDAKAGAAKGAGIGLGLGAVAAIASLVVPGLGIVLGGGALATALVGMAGATAAGAAAGAATGFMVDQGVPDHHVDLFRKAVEAGGAVVSVSTPSGEIGALEIGTILRKYGGVIEQPMQEHVPAPEPIPVN